MPKTRPFEERFWEKVDRRGPDDCWEWTASRAQGYGQLGRGPGTRVPIKASRASWEIHFGQIPEGLFVCHKCDNRGCVNPGHLFLGTPKENTQDMIRKGRKGVNPDYSGSNNPNAKLSPSDIAAIRKSKKKQVDIAAEFGIVQSYVSKIRLRGTWNHLN